MTELKFGCGGNEKLNALAKFLGMPMSHILSFDIPAGFTCAKANICKSYAHRETGKIRQVGRILCYAAKGERYMPNVRNAHWFNYMVLLALGKDTDKIAELLASGMKKQTEIVRVHSSGDFYDKSYFLAWCKVAEQFPNIQFFGYTKHLEYAMYNKPSNFILQYSYGGLDDELYDDYIKQGVKIPAGFIGEYEGQYPHKVVCGDGGEHEDYLEILKGETFQIMEH